MNKIVTSWELAGEKRGKKLGKKLGLEKGAILAKQRAVLMQLEKRFGALPAEIKTRVEAIRSSTKLDALLLAVLDIRALDELPLE